MAIIACTLNISFKSLPMQRIIRKVFLFMHFYIKKRIFFFSSFVGGRRIAKYFSPFVIFFFNLRKLIFLREREICLVGIPSFYRIRREVLIELFGQDEKGGTGIGRGFDMLANFPLNFALEEEDR